MMLIIIRNDSDWSATWWKRYFCFKHVVFNKGLIRGIDFNC